MNMRRPYQITGAVILACALYFMIESLRFRYFTAIGPGPGFFPYWLSVILAVLAGLMILQATFGQPEPMPENFFAERSGYFRIGAVLAAILGTILVLEFLGFRLTMLLMFLFVLLTVGRYSLLVSISLALVGAFGGHLLFVYWLGLRLPRGVFGL